MYAHRLRANKHGDRPYGERSGSTKKIDAVKESYMVYGVYDVIAKVKADTMDKLK